MASIRFGTDGWRAIIARDFTYANLRIVARTSYINSGSGLGKSVVILTTAYVVELLRMRQYTGR